MSAALAIVVWALGAGLMHLVIGVPGGWAALLGVPVAALVVLLRRVPPGEDVVWAPVPAESGVPGFQQASTLASRFADASQDPTRFTTRLQPQLARLADARLRARHAFGLDDPRAVAVLGGDLYALLTDPAARLPGPRRTAELLARLEEM